MEITLKSMKWKCSFCGTTLINGYTLDQLIRGLQNILE